MFVKLELDLQLLALIYLEDIIINNDNEDKISQFRDDIFEIKNLGGGECFLSLEVKKFDRSYFISQRRYAKNLLVCFGMCESKLTAAPMKTHLKLKKE